MGVILIGGSRRPLIPRSDGVEPSSASATFGAWGRVHASGQVQAEYALVVAAIAIGCIVAVLFVGGAVHAAECSRRLPHDRPRSARTAAGKAFRSSRAKRRASTTSQPYAVAL